MELINAEHRRQQSKQKHTRSTDAKRNDRVNKNLKKNTHRNAFVPSAIV